MQEHGFKMPHGVEAICVRSDGQRREDVRSSKTKGVAKKQTDLALNDEGFQRGRPAMRLAKLLHTGAFWHPAMVWDSLPCSFRF